MQKELALVATATGGVFEVEDVYEIVGAGVVVVGRVVEGLIAPGFTAAVLAKRATVASIESRQGWRRLAKAGDAVGIALCGVDETDVTRGMRVSFSRP